MDDWDKYIIPDNSADEWEQYVVTNKSEAVSKSSVQDNLLLGALGASAGYGAYKIGKPMVQGVANLPKIVNSKKGTDFAESIRKAFVQAHTDKVNEFGGRLEELATKNPSQKVSLQNPVSELIKNWDDLPNEVKSVVKKTPHLRDMVGVEKPVVPEIDLKQSQEILNYLKTKVPKNIKANNLDLIDTINNIKGAQLEAFPEMELARSSYKQFIEPYNNVKQYFKFNRLLKSVADKFGGAEGQQAVEKILPKEVIKKLGGYRRAAKLAEIPQDIPFVGRLFKSVGGMMGVAPQALQGVEAIRKYPKNNMAQFYMMATGQDPREDFERWRESQVL